MSGQVSHDGNVRPLTLPPGTVLADQFEIQHPLGQPGGFGIVYLARDRRLNIPVAIKEYFPRELAGRSGNLTSVHPHSGPDEELFRFGLRQFVSEARTLARIRHPNVMQVRTFFEENGTAYMVMDYYEGETLEGALRRRGGTMPADEAVRLMLHLLEGLAAVHQLNVLHRDIKPANIYIANDGRPLLLDFGAARQAVGERSRTIYAILTPGYAPVEQYGSQGTLQGAWTDVYGCAATLYVMLTGLKPPDAPERFGGTDPLRSPESLRPELNPRLGDTVMRGLAVDFKERVQTAEEFAMLLTDVLSAPEETLAMRPPSRRKALIPWAAAVAIILIAGTLLSKQRQNPSPAAPALPAPEPVSAEPAATTDAPPIPPTVGVAGAIDVIDRVNVVGAAATSEGGATDASNAVTALDDPLPSVLVEEPPDSALQAIRDDLGTGRVFYDTGQYASASANLSRASAGLVRLSGSFAETDEVRRLRVEANDLTERIASACRTEVNLALAQGQTPPECR